ncbi:hypothetical protein V5P93_000453 [Actinokineospora auranticolor]|uniref:Uncharacterized protein n=1 Tax=Actinokineospora auranticolor TaxID=155976 RepID=A0A2S6GE52_9PSEU|nr:hypothetical protein [Actinokineospora auranticolor]PPK63493.1 hypothetical protein CLV40_12720 [Actinokineospora auranticolor]
MSADLIEIQDDLGTTAQLVRNSSGGFTLLAGPFAPVGALYQVINDLHRKRVSALLADADGDHDEDEAARRTERLHHAALSKSISDPWCSDVTGTENAGGSGQ